MVNQEFAIKTVQNFLADFEKCGLNLHKAILFGSLVKNTQHQDSDIDLALLADEFTGVGFYDIQLFVNVLKNYIIIQPKTFPTKYFLKGDPFIDEIKKTGLEIPLNLSAQIESKLS